MIGIEISGIDEVMEKLRRLSDARAMFELTKSVAVYLRAEFQKYPGEKRVTRKQAYGKTFFTDKQRRWFFANLGNLQIPYKRGLGLMRGWQVMSFGSYDHIVVNDVSYAEHVMGDRQSRMSKLIGWKKASEITKKNADKIRNIASTFYHNYINKLGLS